MSEYVLSNIPVISGRGTPEIGFTTNINERSMYMVSDIMFSSVYRVDNGDVEDTEYLQLDF